MSEESLKNKTVKGVVWSSVERFSVQGVQFLVMLIIARILTPKDYGLIGMLAIFLAVAQSLIDSGFSQALIRKQDRTEVDNNTVFYFNTVVSIVIYAIFYLSAPVIALFFNEPSLCLILRILGLVIIINGMAVVQRALFTIDINFKVQTKATLIAALLSGVLGIYMAYNGKGVWALVFQQLSNAFLCTTMLWIFSKWRPRLQYSWMSFQIMFNFGSKLMLSGLLNTLYNNIHQLVIGKFFNATSLGFYSRAQQFANLPSSSLTEVLQRVLYPVLCKIQDDKERYREVSRKFLRISVFVIFPIMSILAGISDPLVLLLLGEKWHYSATLLKPLCFAMMLYPVHALNLNAITVIGRSDLFLKLEIIKKIIGIVVLVLSIPFGVIGICYGTLVGSIIGLYVNTYYSGREVGYGLMNQVKDILPILLMSIVIYILSSIVCIIISNNLWIAIVVSLFVGIVVCCLFCLFNKFDEISYIKMLIQ